MAYILANLTKQQFLRPQAFGAPALSRDGWLSHASHYMRGEYFGWLPLILALLEHDPGVPVVEGEKVVESISWHGDQIALLWSKDSTSTFVPEYNQTLTALAQQPQQSSYQYAIANFEEITRKLKGWWKNQGTAVEGRVTIRTIR